jgi:hypothetical protein
MGRKEQINDASVKSKYAARKVTGNIRVRCPVFIPDQAHKAMHSLHRVFFVMTIPLLLDKQKNLSLSLPLHYN